MERSFTPVSERVGVGGGKQAMVNTMWTPQQKVQYVLYLAEEKAVTRVIGSFFFVEAKVSRMGPHPIIINGCVSSWMKNSRIGGSEDEDPLSDHPGHPICLFRLFFLGAFYFSTYCPLKLRHLSFHGIDREVQMAVTQWFRSQATGHRGMKVDLTDGFTNLNIDRGHNHASALTSGRTDVLKYPNIVKEEGIEKLKQRRAQIPHCSLVCRSSTRVCVRICVSIRRPEFECSGPQLEGPEFECSGPQLEGPEFEYSELSLKVCGLRYGELE
ncbi:hypothetical protein ANN_13361 [Periplaneta americana]|uniref:Uncharacterized protein n=1 Tax=Periplaneta americana TaxID=6978 RepID=A0ABQ8TJ79_PERAM|nr:hypothetical protein ANN_13361 [Periplaneta americana]